MAVKKSGHSNPSTDKMKSLLQDPDGYFVSISALSAEELGTKDGRPSDDRTQQETHEDFLDR